MEATFWLPRPYRRQDAQHVLAADAIHADAPRIGNAWRSSVASQSVGVCGSASALGARRRSAPSAKRSVSWPDASSRTIRASRFAALERRDASRRLALPLSRVVTLMNDAPLPLRTVLTADRQYAPSLPCGPRADQRSAFQAVPALFLGRRCAVSSASRGRFLSSGEPQGEGAPLTEEKLTAANGVRCPRDRGESVKGERTLS